MNDIDQRIKLAVARLTSHEFSLPEIRSMLPDVDSRALQLRLDQLYRVSILGPTGFWDRRFPPAQIPSRNPMGWRNR